MSIVRAAIRFNGSVFSVEPPKRHSDIIFLAIKKGHDNIAMKGEKGFITEEGGFVDRIQAAKIAKESGQIEKNVHELYTNDLW